MAIDTSTSPSPIVATATKGATSATGVTNSVTNSKTMAENFTTFLQLLTTQLKNQNPMSPLDTNQFTQQLVQFSQVEQQMKMNSQFETLIQMEKIAQSTAAMAYLGATATVDGSTTKLQNGSADWSFKAAKDSAATITIRDAKGQTVYSGSFSLKAGPQNFAWDGRDNKGTLWPDGNYTMSVTAKDQQGQTVAVSTEVEGTVDSVDLTQDPPVLSIGGQTFTVDKIKRVVRPHA